MFELPKLSGSHEKGIALQTRIGHDIENVCGVELTDIHLRRFDKITRQHAHWEIRKPPSGEYNCAGHVWASRRTCIYEERAWRQILREDGYRKTDAPVPDDLVIYLDSSSGILHMGRVASLVAGVSKESPKIPWIVSKWSDTTGEVFHNVYDHPYLQDFNTTIEYHTDRPKNSATSKQ